METNENLNGTGGQADSDSHLSFGTYLRKVRMEKGFTIEDVMDYTRISKFVLEQIEAENREKLPEDVFLKGFLKAYAEAVGVDPYDVLERYIKAVGQDHQSGSSARRQGARKGSMLRLQVFIGVIAVIVAAVAWVWFSQVNRPVETSSPADISAEETEGATFDDAQPVAVESEVKNSAADGLFLEVVCVEDTTLKIMVDGGEMEEYSLKPEDHLELKAKKMYNILIDNTCGVTLFLNNNPVTVPGKCGQVVTLQLP